MQLDFFELLFEHFLLACLLFYALSYYFATPLIMWFWFSLAAYPNLTVLRLDELSKSQARFLGSQTDALLASGFDEPTYVQIDNAAPAMTYFMVLLVNRQTGDQAMAAIALGVVPFLPFVKLQRTYLKFITYLDEGTVFDSNNYGYPPDWPPGQKRVRSQLPSIKDPQELFRLHSFVMSRHQVKGRKFVYAPGHAVDFLARTFRLTFDEQVERGWLYYLEQGNIQAHVHRSILNYLGSDPTHEVIQHGCHKTKTKELTKRVSYSQPNRFDDLKDA